MAALPYMQLYVADYLADTMHLTAEEHGAYLLLIMNYWQTGKPIPKVRLQSISRVSNDRWNLVEASLNEYFNDTGTHWHHSRIDADLQMVEDAQSQRSKAGKASAEARKRTKQTELKRESNDRSTTVGFPLQRSANENPTNKEEIRIDTDKTRIETEGTDSKKAQAPRKSVFKLPDWIPQDRWQAYIDSRRSMKKHPMSASALDHVVVAIAKCTALGYSVEEVLDVMTENGWRTVRPDFLENARNKAKPDECSNAELAAKLTREFQQGEANAII